MHVITDDLKMLEYIMVNHDEVLVIFGCSLLHTLKPFNPLHYKVLRTMRVGGLLHHGSL